MKLNQKKIDRTKDRGRYGDGRNLYLHVGPNGSKSWLFIPREIAEAALAHAVGGVEGAYQRGDYFHTRRSLMERWGAYCEGASA